MSAGRQALIEAAKREAAAYYGRQIIRTDEPISVFAARAEAELEAALQRRQQERQLARLIREGVPMGELLHAHGFTRAEIRAAAGYARRFGDYRTTT